MGNDELPLGLTYHPCAIPNAREFYGDLLEEFFSTGPYHSTGNGVLEGTGPRLCNIAVRNDRPNPYTEAAGIERAQLRKRLWLPATATLGGIVAARIGELPDLAIFNFYRDGSDYLVPHSDYDHQMGPTTEDVIMPIVSLGASRTMRFIKIGEPDVRVDVELEPGSLLIMRGRFQRQWLHSLPAVGLGACSGRPPHAGARLSVTYAFAQQDPEEWHCWVLVHPGEERLRKGAAHIACGDREEIAKRWLELTPAQREEHRVIAPGPPRVLGGNEAYDALGLDRPHAGPRAALPPF